jgi:hypothetical protein
VLRSPIFRAVILLWRDQPVSEGDLYSLGVNELAGDALVVVYQGDLTGLI